MWLVTTVLENAVLADEQGQILSIAEERCLSWLCARDPTIKPSLRTRHLDIQLTSELCPRSVSSLSFLGDFVLV